MIVKLILILFTIINIYYFNLRKYSRLYVVYLPALLQSFSVLIGFVVYFVVIVRVMNLFREYKLIDIKYYLFNYDISLMIMCVIAIYFLRRNLWFCAKIHWYRLHHLFMHNECNTNFLKPWYNKIFNKYFKRFIYHIFPIIYYLNNVTTIIMYNFFLFDIIFNSWVLDKSLVLVPWYGLFKFIYNIMWYLEYKYNMTLEYYVWNDSYSFAVDFGATDPYYLRTVDRIGNKHLKYEVEVIREIKDKTYSEYLAQADKYYYLRRKE